MHRRTPHSLGGDCGFGPERGRRGQTSLLVFSGGRRRASRSCGWSSSGGEGSRRPPGACTHVRERQRGCGGLVPPCRSHRRRAHQGSGGWRAARGREPLSAPRSLRGTASACRRTRRYRARCRPVARPRRRRRDPVSRTRSTGWLRGLGSGGTAQGSSPSSGTRALLPSRLLPGSLTTVSRERYARF